MKRKGISITILLVIGFSISFFGMGCHDNGGSEVGNNGDGGVVINIGESPYTITTIDLNNRILWTTAEGINDAGEIVGDGACIDPCGYLFDQNEFTIHSLGAYSLARGINNLGQIIGYLGNCSCNGQPFGTESYLWDEANNSLTTVEVPDSSTEIFCYCNRNSTFANGINDLTQIVGNFTDASNFMHGFLYEEGDYVTLDVPGAISTVANGINNLGQIIGNFQERQELPNTGVSTRGYMATPVNSNG